MYHVTGTGLTALLLYSISLIFSRLGYFSLQSHRKLWNFVLAATFIVAALAGVFMALQINYKWNIPFIKTVLKWHVEAGIGMAFTGMIHFIRHLPYFGKIFKNPETFPENPAFRKYSSSVTGTNLFIIGFVSSSIQFLLIREMMNIAGGYELITGVFLGSWLIGSAIGASLAGKSQLNDIRKINLVFSLSPVISLILLLFLSRIFLTTGETPSFLVSMIFTFLVLIPFCLVSGFTFVRLISAAREGNGFVPGKSFSIETAGGVVAGIIISLLSSGILNTYQLILTVILLTVTYVLVTYYLTDNKTIIFLKIVVLFIVSAIILSNPDILFRQILLPGIKVTGSKDTAYGNVTKGRYKGEESTYYNQKLLSYKDDVILREENIHYAMLQSDSPGKVILISGSLRSHLPEILKYPVKKLIYIERDPELVRSETLPDITSTAEIVISGNDAFRYIRDSDEKADVVIMLIPPPSTLLLNRYYTTEFFNDIKKRLNPGGIFLCSPGPGDNYFNKESLDLYSSIYNSLVAVFKNVKPLVGNKLYFISSDKAVSLSVCRLATERNIINTYVSSDYLSDDLIKKRSDEVLSLFDPGVRQNKSAFPVANFYFQSYNFSKNLNEKIPAILIMIIAFAVPVVTVKRRNLIMYFSASALAAFEIIILLTLQLIIGNMYQLTGLIVAGVMTGLAVGAGMDFTFLNSLPMRIKGIILILYYIGTGLIYNFILAMNSGLPAVCIIILSAFVPALFTGHIFRELTLRSDAISAPSPVYSADLAGSAFGFILISGFAVPVLGIQVSIYLLSALIFTGFLFGTISRKL
jgi:spermidine synthase